MTLKQYFSEILLGLAVIFMLVYPPLYGAVVFALALAAIGAFRAIDELQLRSDAKSQAHVQAQIDKLKTDVERLVLTRQGHR